MNWGKIVLMAAVCSCAIAWAQAQTEARPPGKGAAEKDAQSQPQSPNELPNYSGAYSFLKEGELVQITVEDDGRVNGFISRYENGDHGNFVDQFFKTGKLDGNKITFTTKAEKGVSFEFRGVVVRGEGKNPGDEAYFVLDGTLTENVTDTNKKTTSTSQSVKFRIFPNQQ